MGALQVNYRIYADVRNENTGKIVAKQNDTKTRYLDITVTDNGVPIDLTGCEVRIYGKKYDNTEFYNDGSLQDAAAGRCLFEATTQMLAYPGQNVHCEIVVFKDNVQILSTMPFDIFVVKSLMGESAIESSNEYGALVVLFQNLYEAHDLMTTMVQNIGNPSDIAAQYNLATMWQAWEFLTDYMKTDLTNMIEQALANASVQGVLDKIGNTADTGGSDTAGTLMAKDNAGLSMLNRIKTLTGFYAADFKKENIINFDNINLTATTLAHGTSKKIASFVCKKSGNILISCSGYVTRSSRTTYAGGGESGICYCINGVDLAGLDVGTVYANAVHSDFNLIGEGVSGGSESGKTGVTGGDVIVHVNAGEILDLFINGATSSYSTTAEHKNLICTMYAFDF